MNRYQPYSVTPQRQQSEYMSKTFQSSTTRPNVNKFLQSSKVQSPLLNQIKTQKTHYPQNQPIKGGRQQPIKTNQSQFYHERDIKFQTTIVSSMTQMDQTLQQNHAFEESDQFIFNSNMFSPKMKQQYLTETQDDNRMVISLVKENKQLLARIQSKSYELTQWKNKYVQLQKHLFYKTNQQYSSR